MLPIIFGLSGLELTPQERDFFREANPFGFILFRRNVDTPQQVKKLTDNLRELSGRPSVPVLIDQEGGRVQRLRPPHWVDMPEMRSIGNLFVKNSLMGMQMADLHAEIIAAQLNEIGINVVCAPVLDVPVPGAHDVIGNRAYSENPNIIIPLASCMAKEFLSGGITPIIKHIPGHGRACADSHHACPVVTTDKDTLDQTDFKTFRKVAQNVGHEKLWAMTAHIVFDALDEQPVSVSKKAIEFLRRDLNIIGPIIPDAVEMEALGGSIASRALATIKAGCDASLHCSGNLQDMQEIASVLPTITDTALQRFNAAEEAREKDVAQKDWRELYAKLENGFSIKTIAEYEAHEALTIA